jgi:hypothetical protein
MQYVPVVDKNQNPLMPTTPNRAATWIKSGKATPFFKKGVFCVRLNVEPSARNMQDIAIGIDPGSKREGFTIGSEAHQYLNIQTEAVQHVKDAIQTRREMRRGRRFRKTPCRQNRQNRAIGKLAPSTKARWDWKIRIAQVLAKIFPISAIVIEDIKAHCFGGRRWNQSFSPLQIGKKYGYAELKKIAPIFTVQGFETYELRNGAGLKKSSDKLAETFDAHCVDSYILMRYAFGSYPKPENTNMLIVAPLRFHRRQLHALQPSEGGIRRPYGGTRSLGFKRGSLIKHSKYGFTFVGGASNGRISLHHISTGKRLTQNAKPEDTKFLSFNAWRTALPLRPKGRSLRAA